MNQAPVRLRALVFLTLALALALAGPGAAMARMRTIPGRTVRPVPSILGGTSAVGTTLGMVARIVYDEGNGTEDLCSGTVVSSNVILTAGHCAENVETGVVDAASGYQVMTGSQSLAIPGQLSGVSAVIPYPLFDPSIISWDAALLVLTTPTTVAPVALATEPAASGLYNGGVGAAIAGWGIDDSLGDTASTLQYGSTVVQSATYCEQRAGELGIPFNPAIQLCAIDAPTYADGTCKGDSGGPILTVVDQAWVQIGLTSFGDPNCSTGQAGFFTRTDLIDSWIHTEITQHAPPAPAAPTPTTPPAPAPAPTTPQAGTYFGRTSQHQAISYKVNASDSALVGLQFGFRLRCSRHRPVIYTITLAHTWRLVLTNSMTVATRFRDRTNTHYRFAGTFSSTGTAAGTLSATWHTSRYGACTTGQVHWTASNAPR